MPESFKHPKKAGKPVHAISVDVEEWHHAELLRPAADRMRQTGHEPQSQVVAATETLLDLFEKHDVHGTFFVLGDVAQAHPDLVNRIARDGHELASHGFTHRPLHALTPESFNDELAKTEKYLEKYSGQRIRAFRAPTFSLNQKTAWALEVLERRGYHYDSSVFPVHTGFYGIGNAPLHPYHPDLKRPAQTNANTRLLEVPPAVMRIAGKRIPVAGGFYLRFLPYAMLEYGIRQIESENRPAVLYVHPWEFHARTPVPAGVSHKDRWISFHGRNTGLEKLDKLLERFAFGTVREAVMRFA